MLTVLTFGEGWTLLKRTSISWVTVQSRPYFTEARSTRRASLSKFCEKGHPLFRCCPNGVHEQLKVDFRVLEKWGCHFEFNGGVGVLTRHDSQARVSFSEKIECCGGARAKYQHLCNVRFRETSYRFSVPRRQVRLHGQRASLAPVPCNYDPFALIC
ncbi:hypothetical protein GCM10025790_28120 [Nesterenkonia rhizosphaerae]|uniref:Uncharacterized protein n=1 Tax=Nesterenkonia rhizosphaerae TaxID=1348272 RepID=A0ABP9G873_9MICC